MSPERIRSENYSYPADIWSLGLSILECGTGKFPYTANDGPANLMLQVRYCSAILFPFLLDVIPFFYAFHKLMYYYV